jgi:pantetheine-phosphate adenylyltransferase
MSNTAIYAGSFDPLTFGHLDVAQRAANLFPELIVAVGIHPTRNPLFTVEERVEMIKAVVGTMPNVRVASFDGLLVEYARKSGARVIVRGLRVGADFEHELQIAHANADLADELDTIFLPTRRDYGFISASLVREIARHGGEVGRYAPPAVCDALHRKYAARS